jgi:putative salt-induced outer membrane protein YdiY
MLSTLALFLLGSQPAAASDVVPAPAEPVGSALPVQDKKEEPKNVWTGSLSLGGVLTTGNSETRNANMTADLVYRREKDRTTLGAIWTYSEEKNTTSDWNLTDRRAALKAKYDYFLSQKSYIWGNASIESDLAATLDLRTTVGAGYGYQWKETDTYKVSTEVGAAWFKEEFDDGTDDDYITARGAYYMDWKINKTWSLGQIGEVFPSVEDSDDFYARVDTRLKAQFTERFFGQLQWLYDYDNTPAAGKDREDNRFLLGVGWKI